MHILKVRNVAEALPLGVQLLQQHGKKEKSQYGDVLVFPTPVTTVYSHPRERVLLSAQRNANPAFNLFEALWHLDGRNNAAFLTKYIQDFAYRFAEKDGKIHDAYGHRWRDHFDFDQLEEIIRRLTINPDDRQCVLQIWDARCDLKGQWKTRPCNTNVYFRMNNDALDITTCCRSNDIIWGAYGTNAVSFSILQEYLAAFLECSVGVYYQISNNYHAYLDILSKMNGDLNDARTPSSIPLVHDAETFDEELYFLMYSIDKRRCHIDTAPGLFSNRFLSMTAWPMAVAFRMWREGQKQQALEISQSIESEDWRIASIEWFERRMKKSDA